MGTLKEKLKYMSAGQKIDLLAGVVGSQIPSYGFCLLATKDPLNALYAHVINSTARGIGALVGIGTGHEEGGMALLMPELAGFFVGTGISMGVRIERERKKSRQGLEDLTGKNSNSIDS
jgi:hypothetical protein